MTATEDCAAGDLTALDAATIDQLQGAVGAVVLVRLIDRYVEFAGEKSTALAAA
ncbi:MAG: hypothetical protein IT561_28590, partial [Alphaproteobacteria bacterium]|nr:hypothetical protein [Alphaproteobacteria bacterium]